MTRARFFDLDVVVTYKGLGRAKAAAKVANVLDDLGFRDLAHRLVARAFKQVKMIVETDYPEDSERYVRKVFYPYREGDE